MNLVFTANGWRDYQYWAHTDAAILTRINAMIDEIRRTPFRGLGKPEPLRGDLAGWLSRRITDEHRLIYRVEGRPDIDQKTTIAACRYHYERER